MSHDVTRLARLLNQPVNAPALTVWHTSVRDHSSDRPLTDDQNHIHLVATLVRQDGTTAWGWNEKYKAQAAARRLERELGQTVGPSGPVAGGTARPGT